MRMIKRMAALVAAAALAASVCGCSLASSNSVKYVKSLLDLQYKDNPQAYLRLTESEESEAERLYADGISAEAEYFADYIGTQLSDETRPAVEEMLKKIYEKASYKVSGGKEQSDGVYIVEVTVKPVMVIQDSMEDLTAFIDSLMEEEDLDDIIDTPRQKIRDRYVNGIVDIISKRIDKTTYGDPVTIKVEVEKNKEEAYAISDSDFTMIDQAIIQYESDTVKPDKGYEGETLIP